MSLCIEKSIVNNCFSYCQLNYLDCTIHYSIKQIIINNTLARLIVTVNNKAFTIMLNYGAYQFYLLSDKLHIYDSKTNSTFEYNNQIISDTITINTSNVLRNLEYIISDNSGVFSCTISRANIKIFALEIKCKNNNFEISNNDKVLINPDIIHDYSVICIRNFTYIIYKYKIKIKNNDTSITIKPSEIKCKLSCSYVKNLVLHLPRVNRELINIKNINYLENNIASKYNINNIDQFVNGVMYNKYITRIKADIRNSKLII